MRCEQVGPDVKAEALLDWLYRLQSDENDAYPEMTPLLVIQVEGGAHD